MALEWKDVSGDELQQRVIGGQRIDDLVASCRGVYAWRLRLEPSLLAVQDSKALAEWIERLLRTPIARVVNAEVTSFLALEGVRLGGAALSQHKQRDLQNLLSHERGRNHVISYLKSMQNLIPPLYVGESCNVPRRIAEHVGGKSDFAYALEKHLSIGWEHLRLSYVDLGPAVDEVTDKTRNVRLILEMLTARLSIAGFTTRPG